MQKSKHAMTLIELMIVIAIIGILAAFAIPSYQRYVAKARVTEMVALFSSCELALNKAFLDTNAFPDPINCWGGINDGGSNPPDGFGAGTYEIGTTSGGYPKMRMSLSHPSVPAKNGSSGGLLWFGMAYDNATGSLVKACGSYNQGATDIDNENLPKDCKDEIATAIWGL